MDVKDLFDQIGHAVMRGLSARLQSHERPADQVPPAAAIQKPPGTRWAWRPAPWCGPVTPHGMVAVPSGTAFADGLTLFHDCPEGAITLRQIKNTDTDVIAAFGVQMDVLQFAGSYLSLVVHLPEAAVADLRPDDIFQLRLHLAQERAGAVYLRLNIKSGPNAVQLTDSLPWGDDDGAVEFDLATTGIAAHRIDELWLDLIFEAPAMNRMVLNDLTLCRYRRADI